MRDLLYRNATVFLPAEDVKMAFNSSAEFFSLSHLTLTLTLTLKTVLKRKTLWAF
jgi:hypothetical protein